MSLRIWLPSFFNICSSYFLYFLIYQSKVYRYLMETAGNYASFVRFEVFTAVTMQNSVFWDVTPCGSCKSRRFGGTWSCVRRLLVAASVVPSSPIFATLMKEAPGSFETSVLTRATWRNNPEDTILHLP
jgi:hypothetical protein